MATACLAQPTSTQIQFCEPAFYFSPDAWLLEGVELIKHGRRLAEQDSCRQWDIGDWLLKGWFATEKKLFKKREYKKQVKRITGRSWGGLRNLMTIARQVPESRRRDGREGRNFLSYAIHVEAAKFDDETQEKLLKFADSGNRSRLHSDGTHARFSVRDFKQFIAREQDLGYLPKIGKVKLKKPTPKGYSLKVWVSEENYGHLCRLSLALGPSYSKQTTNTLGRREYEPLPESALFWCAVKYMSEHKAELLDRVAKDQAERAKEVKICMPSGLPSS